MTSLSRSRLSKKVADLKDCALDLLLRGSSYASECKLDRDDSGNEIIRYTLNEISKMPRMSLKMAKAAYKSLGESGIELGKSVKWGAATTVQFSLGDVRAIYAESGIESFEQMKTRLGGNKLNPITIAFMNLKGGVGKTTSSVSVASGLVSSKNLICHQLKVLLIDMDPQGSASKAFGLSDDNNPYNHSAAKAIMEAVSPDVLKSWIVPVENNDGLSILPASTEDAFYSVYINHEFKDDKKTDINGLLHKYVIEPLKDDYDVIIIDCAPNIEQPIINVLNAADAMLIPTALDPLDFDSTLRFIIKLDWLLPIAKPINLDSNKIKFIASKFDENNALHRDNLDILNAYFPGMLFNSVIPNTKAFSLPFDTNETIYTIPRKHYPGDPKSLMFAKTAMDRVVYEVFNRFLIADNESGSEANG
ncbi:Plasmid partition protein A [compost metagenome]